MKNIILIGLLFIPLYYYILLPQEETIYIVDDINDISTVDSTDIYLKSRISCKSDSMGLIINCKDIVYSQLLGLNDTMVEGRIYIYKKGAKEVIHRLVKCLDDSCNEMIFKGDNNYIADKLVLRSQIVKEVVQIGYR